MVVGQFLLSAIALGQLVAGYPAGTQLARRNAQDGSDIVLYDSSVTGPVRVPQVLVWVDDAGEPVRTATETVLLLPTSLPPGAKSKDSTTTITMTALSTQTLVVTASATPSASVTSGRAAPTGQTSPVVPGPGKPQDGRHANSSDSGSLFGISYAPYRADHACKSKQDIENDFRRFAGSYSLVRIYGTDCDQVRNVYSAAKAHGMKVFLGIWEPSLIVDEANKIISGVNGDWDMVHTVSVGNELVNNGQASPQQIVRAVKNARSTLRAAGYMGPVVAVDTFVAARDHPELCEQSDYCAINAHAFFDGTVSASESGRWLQDTVRSVKSALSVPKKVVVTETGWPMKGEKNGMAVPSLREQKSAIDSIKKEFASTPGDVILFSAFNDLWKTRDMATFNSEQYWGIDGAISASDE